MKRFFCVFLTLLILMGSTAVMASPATDTDLVHIDYPSTDTDLPPVATPSPEVDISQLSDWEKLIYEFLEAYKIDPDTVSFAYYNTVTEEEHYFQGDKAMTAASLKKLPLNMYYAEKLYNGEIDWDTTYGGVSYKLVQEYSLRYSNNEYTDILINAIGDYPTYRRAMLPYIGLEEEDVEFSYLTVNEFTAEEMMYCLKLLYADPERYPGVMENMLLATPGEYFEQKTEDYEIAQKYGWYVQDGHNCINCVGIVDTEDPILLAVFSDNCSMGKDILGEYCALMVGYTEETVAVRKEAEAALGAEEEAEEPQETEAPQPTSEPQSTPAPAEKVPETDPADKENALRLVACVTACAILAIAMGMVTRKKKKPADSNEKPGHMRNILSLILGAAGIIAIIATIILCARGLQAKPIIKDEGNDPAIVAEEFISLALEGKSSEAEKLLLGSSTLGLDSKPGDALGAMLYDALLESFSYEAKGSCTEDSIDASQIFTVTYLDLPSITALQQEATNARLAQYVEKAQRAEEVLAEDGSYLPEVAMAALEEVTAELLADAESHYVQTELTIRLRYSGGEWKVIADEELFAVLSGNTAY